MYSQQQKAILINNLLLVLDLMVDKNTNTVVYRENRKPVLFNGKNIKCSTDGGFMYLGENDVELDPTNYRNTKLMNAMLGLCICNETANESINKVVSIYLQDEDIENNTQSVYVKFEVNGPNKTMNTKPYRNKALAYTEMIFKLEGSFANMDLSIFDNDLNF